MTDTENEATEPQTTEGNCLCGQDHEGEPWTRVQLGEIPPFLRAILEQTIRDAEEVEEQPFGDQLTGEWRLTHVQIGDVQLAGASRVAGEMTEQLNALSPDDPNWDDQMDQLRFVQGQIANLIATAQAHYAAANVRARLDSSGNVVTHGVPMVAPTK